MLKPYLLTLLLLATFAVVSKAEIHAVLCAGSKGYSNYRHQSDICHAYQILLQNGVKKENIIVMSFNDAAHAPQNPYPGTLFNKPTEGQEKGVNVNNGCVIDYEGDEVTPENYLAVITGNSTAVFGGSGRVLNSGPEDNVFLNFVDHGEPGVMDFPPDGFKSRRLFADQINEAFVKMHSQNMYKQLTYYLETCYSGSIFQSTPADLNIYAVSAANAHQSSWAAYCPPQEDVIEGKHLGTCLGDLFSVNWMQNTQSVDTNSETLQAQYEVVRDGTAATGPFTQGSEVLQWADVNFTMQPISTFLGSSKQRKNQGFLEKMNNIYKKSYQPSENRAVNLKAGLWSVLEAETNYLLNQFQKNPSVENFEALNRDLIQTKKYNQLFEKFMQKYGKLMKNQQSDSLDTDFTCYRFLIDSVESKCGPINDFSKPHLLNLYNFCAQEVNFPYEMIQFEC